MHDSIQASTAEEENETTNTTNSANNGDVRGFETSSTLKLSNPKSTKSGHFASYHPMDEEGAPAGYREPSESNVISPRNNAVGGVTKRRGFRPSVFEAPVWHDKSGGISGGTQCEGFLEKKSTGAWSRWQQRWFQLKGHYLTYYMDRNKKKILAAVDMNESIAVEFETGRRNTQFYITMKSGRKYQLRALGVQDARNWVHNLRNYDAPPPESPGSPRIEESRENNVKESSEYRVSEAYDEINPVENVGESENADEKPYSSAVLDPEAIIEEYRAMDEDGLQAEAEKVFILAEDPDLSPNQKEEIVARMDALHSEMTRRADAVENEAQADSPEFEAEADPERKVEPESESERNFEPQTEPILKPAPEPKSDPEAEHEHEHEPEHGAEAYDRPTPPTPSYLPHGSDDDDTFKPTEERARPPSLPPPPLPPYQHDTLRAPSNPPPPLPQPPPCSSTPGALVFWKQSAPSRCGLRQNRATSSSITKFP